MPRAFLSDEGGSGTISALFWFLTTLMLLAVAVDGSNAWRAQHQLQVAADATALVAAAHATRETDARILAQRAIALNLGPLGLGDAIADGDIVFGRYDPEADLFETGMADPNAVHVVARRTRDRLNSVPAYLLKLIGRADWEIGAVAVAMMRTQPAGCSSATVVTRDVLSLGGGSTWLGDVCLHGERGVQTGGNGHYGKDVRISAADPDTIRINSIRPSSEITAQDLARVTSLEPRILPLLPQLHQAARAAVQGRDGQVHTAQDSPFPAFMAGAQVVELTAHHVVFKPAGSLKHWEKSNPGIVEIATNTIYHAPGSVTFAGNVDASRVAIVAQQSLIIGGGANLAFEDVFFLVGDTINAAGNIRWGKADSYCDSGRFNSYLFAGKRLSLGGGTRIHGVVGAAPTFAPGGALNGAGGIYFEADKRITMGGAAHVSGCDAPLESDFPIAVPGTVPAQGSFLIR